MSKVEVIKSQRILFLKFVSAIDGYTWETANVYGSNEESLRGAFQACPMLLGNGQFLVALVAILT